VRVPYADRLDLPGLRMFEQSLRLSLTASNAAHLDCYNQFIAVSRFPGPAPRALGMYRKD
jgi:hypothetical protein